MATASLDGATLGFEAPSLFVAIRKPHPGANTTVWTLPEDEAAVQAWTTAAATVTPFLQGWLGQRPRSQLTLLDLPDPQDAPFETGALLADRHSPGQPGPVGRHSGPRAHPRLDAVVPRRPGSARAWRTSWARCGSRSSRAAKQALSALEARRAALALAEPRAPAKAQASRWPWPSRPVYYRTKAAYVLWMLRDLAGDATLSAALRAYDPAQDFGQSAAADSSAFEKLLEQAEDSSRSDPLAGSLPTGSMRTRACLT